MVPAKRGLPMYAIGTNVEAPDDENKLAYFRHQVLPIKPLSDLRIRAHNSFRLVRSLKSVAIRVLPKATGA